MANISLSVTFLVTFKKRQALGHYGSCFIKKNICSRLVSSFHFGHGLNSSSYKMEKLMNTFNVT
ncbi:hypothetical protein MAR_034837 [Mya arenaria]|uniref:Uncharacterized protein n=1 Tax=Mya arenaria TaxID=6604 RepID=A0ABY7ERE4_MYAAR|nr:hypothetical protein MAR_034837 [Mya arenaria]